MFCHNCGKELPEGAIFCPYCGAKLIVNQEEIAGPAPEETIEEASAAGTEEAVPAEEEAAEVLTVAEEEDQEPAAETEAAAEESGAEEAPAIEEPAAEEEAAPEVSEEAPAIEVSAAEEATEPEVSEEAPADEPSAEEAAPEEEAETEAEAGPSAEAEPEPEADAAAEPPADAEKVSSEEAGPEMPKEEKAVPSAPIGIPASEPPKPKKSKLPIIIAVLLIAALGIGFYAFNNTPEKKYARALSAAQQLSESGKHEEAEAAYEALLPDHEFDRELLEALTNETVLIAEESLRNGDMDRALECYQKACDNAAKFSDKRPSEILSGAFEAMKDHTEALAAEGKYRQAIEDLDQSERLLNEYIEDIETLKTDLVRPWTDEVIKTGDIDKMNELATELDDLESSWILGYVPDECYDDLATAITDIEMRERFSEYAEEISGYLDPLFDGENDESSALAFEAFRDKLSKDGEYSDLYSWLIDKADEMPVITAVEGSGKGTERKVGIYSVEDFYIPVYYLYYGEYDGDMRDGEGIWLYADGSYDASYTDYYAVCSWENDVPEGEAFELERTKKMFAANETVRAVRSTVKNGLYEGEVEFEYRVEGVALYGNYTDGRPEILDRETPNGDSAFIIAYTRDKQAWLTNRLAETIVQGIMSWGD